MYESAFEVELRGACEVLILALKKFSSLHVWLEGDGLCHSITSRTDN